MKLVDVLEAEDITQLQQALLGAIGRLEEVLNTLRDTTTVRVTIEFEKRA